MVRIYSSSYHVRSIEIELPNVLEKDEIPETTKIAAIHSIYRHRV